MSPSKPPGPSIQDWLLLIIGTAFVVSGLVILPNDPTVGLVTIGLFGSCMALAMITIRRKFNYRKLATLETADVRVAGGVPIRPSKSTAIVMALWTGALGLLILFSGAGYPFAFHAIGGFLAAVGGLLLFATQMGWMPPGFLQFDPEAFTIGHRRFAARIPWDNIARVSEGEYHSNPVLLLDVHDPLAVAAVPAEAQEKLLKTLRTNRTWTGADFMVMTTQFALDLPVLSRAILRYAQNPAARSELTKRLG